jgi:hypothetical protein
MDVSKLPRLSETKPQGSGAESSEAQAPAPQTPPAPSRPVDYGTGERAMIGAEIWFSVIIGLILVLYTAHFGKFLIATATGHEFHTGVLWSDGTPNAGKEVPYTQLEGGTFFSDSSLFFFGVAILIGAVAQFAWEFLGKRGFAWFSLIITAMATLYCIVAVVILMQIGAGLPLMTLLCVALGGYAVIYEYSALKRAR